MIGSQSFKINIQGFLKISDCLVEIPLLYVCQADIVVIHPDFRMFGSTSLQEDRQGFFVAPDRLVVFFLLGVGGSKVDVCDCDFRMLGTKDLEIESQGFLKISDRLVVFPLLSVCQAEIVVVQCNVQVIRATRFQVDRQGFLVVFDRLVVFSLVEVSQSDPVVSQAFVFISKREGGNLASVFDDLIVFLHFARNVQQGLQALDKLRMSLVLQLLKNRAGSYHTRLCLGIFPLFTQVSGLIEQPVGFRKDRFFFGFNFRLRFAKRNVPLRRHLLLRV